MSTVLVTLGVAGSVVAVALATSAPIVKFDDPKTDKDKTIKKVSFAHDSEVDTYLTSVRSFMLVPPRDGRFGASRVPTLHGVAHSTIPGFDAVSKLVNENYTVASYVVGKMPDEWLHRYDEAIKNGQVKQSDIPKYRATMVHWNQPATQTTSQTAQQRVANGRNYNEFRKDMMTKIMATQDKCLQEGLSEYSDSIQVGAKPSWIMAKSVVASDKSCYSCHTNIKQGEPIGYVMAVLVKNSP